ncbi:hypothetical protein QW131_09885 [Roseibium salinum]|nr:hypothetical protein [Roseibium salinum]
MLAAVGGGGTIFGILATAATAAVGVIKGAAAAIGGAILGISWPIAAVIAAVAALGIAIYRYWEPIREFTLGFADAVGAGLSAAMTAITGFVSELTSKLSGWAADRLVDIGAILGIEEAPIRAGLDTAKALIFGTLDAIVDAVLALPARIGSWISDIFTQEDYSAKAEAGFRDAGRRAGQALVDAIIDAFSQLWEFLRSIPERVVDAIGKIDLSNIFRWPSMPGWLGGGAPAPAKAALDGARAAGGPVVGGRTYQVAEKKAVNCSRQIVTGSFTVHRPRGAFSPEATLRRHLADRSAFPLAISSSRKRQTPERSRGSSATRSDRNWRASRPTRNGP